MLSAKDMQKWTIYCPKHRLSAATSTLHELGVLHVIEHDDKTLPRGTPDITAEAYSEAIIKVRSLLAALAALPPKHENQHGWVRLDKIGPHTKEDHTAALTKISDIHQSVQNTIQHINATQQTLSELTATLARIRPLTGIPIRLDQLSGYSTLSVIAGSITTTKGISAINKVAKPHEMHHSKEALVLFCRPCDETAFRAAIGPLGFVGIDGAQLPKDKKTPSQAAKALEEKITKVQDELAALNRKKNASISKHLDFLQRYEAVLAAAIEKAEFSLRCSATEQLIIIKGWVPAEKAADTKRLLETSTDCAILIQHHPAGAHDDIPTQMDNPRMVKPFELLTQLYTLPKTKEIDPTALMAFTFPLFFGFMLGDIGYGLVSLAIFGIMRIKMKSIKDFADILIAASIWTILFGVLFGEFFGAEAIAGHHLWHIMSRGHQVNDLLMLSVIIGAIHVNAGLLIGFINVHKRHGLRHAILEKISWIVLEAAAVLFYVGTKNPIYTWIGAGTLALAVIMLWFGEGVKGLIELPAIFTNILSYARLMAIGLASISLAEVINRFGEEFFAQGPTMWIPAILILVVGHTINLLLGLMGPFLHSLRLHYVEFFSKFYEGGGTPYKPFGGT
ncbi:MAG: V-type ATP synthase subunit I [Nanoarchaeota archaeon]